MARDSREPDRKSTPPSAGRRPILIVAGPTASGKSGLAVALAVSLGGTVINADSMQVYRELSVLTARPTEAMLARAPHRLYGVLSARELCSAGSWRRLALAEIAAAEAAGQLPIVTGGTGLYLRALTQGLAPIPPIPAEVRDRVRRRYEAIGAAAFQAELAARDPVMGGRIRPGDRQRQIRAAEVLEATGRSLADWQSEAGQAPGEHAFMTLLIMPPRAALYAAANARLARMLEEGALEEVRDLMALGLSPAMPALKALGVADLGRHLAGEVSLDAALAASQAATRRYAKRQVTWFRHQPLPATILLEQYYESLPPEIFAKIRQFLLTPGD
ncbi:MAG: tRNA (adenosine(37)-N6)-dimethylallyltransferase MiaA [Proteobacteria bacterium]|nr:tRNA (adenosine(37)-N6)-dimethylallyltransferase MiaA [Pseudomonadota bacterium]MBI3496316.1 tRNA (adenosine(37)-N6)-dimethylallyltransferase MiaA [Pseudomonadota bacterium]